MYSFESLSLLEGSQLQIDSSAGYVFAAVRQGLTYRTELVEVGGRGNLVMAVAGAEPIELERLFSGMLIAPYASVYMRYTGRTNGLTRDEIVVAAAQDADEESAELSSSLPPWYDYSGAVFARDIVIDDDVVVRHDFFEQAEIFRPESGSGLHAPCTFSEYPPCPAGLACRVGFGGGVCVSALGGGCIDHDDCTWGTHCSGGNCELGAPLGARCNGPCEPGRVCSLERCQAGLGSECVTTQDCAPAPCGERPVLCEAGWCVEDDNAIPQGSCSTAQSDAGCLHGDPTCNTCVNNVVRAFRDLSTTPDGRVGTPMKQCLGTKRSCRSKTTDTCRRFNASPGWGIGTS